MIPQTKKFISITISLFSDYKMTKEHKLKGVASKKLAMVIIKQWLVILINLVNSEH